MKGKWFAFGCLTSIVVIVAIIFSIFYTLIKMGDNFKTDKKLKIPPGSYLSLVLKGEITEYNEFDDSIFGQDKSFAHEIIHKINRAGTDDSIAGIILEPHMISCGYAVMNEIKQALDNFSSQGKPVYAYLETALNKDYLLACSADKIYLNPSSSAGIILTGVGGEILFYKEMFDKIGVEINVIHAGKYKGAGETFSRDQFTQPVTDNLDLLFEDIYQNMLTTIATDRQLPREVVRGVFETRKEIFINRENALDSGLVDQLIYHDEFIENIGINSDQLINWSKYKMPAFRTSDQQIAVVYLQGEITSAQGNYSISTINYQKLNKIIEDIEKDDRVKGVVLRVNSPGGSALESENIYSRLEKLNSKKPMVVSMSNVAASGGYYISAGADYIYADPFTITGSIGVVAMFPNIKQLSDKIGINNQQFSKGKYANAFSLYEKPDYLMLAEIRENILDVYLEFKDRVANGRHIDLNQVESVAQGQIWSSAAARSGNLIDSIGLLSDAVVKAAQLAGIDDYTVSYYPEKKNFFEEILRKAFNMDLAVSLGTDELNELLPVEEFKHKLKSIRQEPIQMILPFRIED